MRKLNFPVYDADNHTYEPEDAFLRHLPKSVEKDFYFVEKEGRKKLVINGMLSEFIPNPTFEVVSRSRGAKIDALTPGFGCYAPADLSALLIAIREVSEASSLGDVHHNLRENAPAVRWSDLPSQGQTRSK